MLQYLAFVRQHPTMLAFGFLAVFSGNFGQSFFIAWFGASIQQDLGVSAGLYGSIYSLGTLGAAGGVMWLGGLIDRVPLRSYTLAAAVGLALGCLLMWRAAGPVSLFLGIFFLRLFGQSLLPHTGITSMGRYFALNRGKAISIAMSGVPIGEMLLPMLAVAIMALMGWQQSFLLIAGTIVALLMPAFWFLTAPVVFAAPEAAAAEPGDDAAPGGRRALLTDYRYWLALPALLLNPFMITGIFIHQNYIVSEKGWTVAWLAVCFTVYGGVHWLSSLLSGALVDRFRAVRLLPFFLLPLLLALLALAFLPGWWTALLIMSLLGISAGSTPPVTGSLWPEIYGTRRLGAIRSMNMAIMVLATAGSPVLFGYLIDRGVSVSTLFGSCALFAALAIMLISLSYPLRSHTMQPSARRTILPATDEQYPREETS